jgi:hypothetical protein
MVSVGAPTAPWASRRARTSQLTLEVPVSPLDAITHTAQATQAQPIATVAAGPTLDWSRPGPHMPSSTYDIASQQHALAQNQDCLLCAPTVKTVPHLRPQIRHRPSSLHAARMAIPPRVLRPSPCVAPLPVCCVSPTHVTPPRRAAFGSVACSAGGLRKERGYAWGVSGREGAGKKACSVAAYNSQLRCPSPAGRTGSLPLPRRGAGRCARRRASGTGEDR